MEDLKILASSIAQIAEEKGIAYEKIIEVIEQALAAAYKKDHDRKGENIIAKLDPKTGEIKFWQGLEVVSPEMIYSEEEIEKMKEKADKDKEKETEETDKETEEEEKIRFNPKRHIMINEALKLYPKRADDIKQGEEFLIPLEAENDYGRIAAQTAKQVILQRLKEAEREAVLEEYEDKEETIVSGIVQRKEGQNVFFDLGKITGVLPSAEQIPGEIYSVGQRYRLFLKSVEPSSRGPLIVLSRAYPKFISKLFEIEVPEVSAGQVEIKSIAREPGFRTKVAVASTEEGVDPIGAMVGQRGTRVTAVINSLNGEKIDIIEWSEDPKKFISNALSPAKVIEVQVEEKGKALVVVPNDQLSLAIGKGGQNVRLAAKLTGWKIDVEPEEKISEEPSKEEKEEDSKDSENNQEEKPVKNKTKAKSRNKDKNKGRDKDKNGDTGTEKDIEQTETILKQENKKKEKEKTKTKKVPKEKNLEEEENKQIEPEK